MPAIRTAGAADPTGRGRGCNPLLPLKAER